MLFLEWKNKRIGDFDIFAILNEKEKNELVTHFGTPHAESVSISKQYFYFINSIRKTITPMPVLYLAFGGQYNAWPPYGDEVPNFPISFKEYELVAFEGEVYDE